MLCRSYPKSEFGVSSKYKQISDNVVGAGPFRPSKKGGGFSAVMLLCRRALD